MGVYSGPHDPHRNPNTAMQRVVANTTGARDARDVTPSMSGAPNDDRLDWVVTVTLDILSGELLDEAELAGFAFYGARPSGGALAVEFGVPTTEEGE